eukprot:7629089-Alexandrium_andersonii.AAC.1
MCIRDSILLRAREEGRGCTAARELRRIALELLALDIHTLPQELRHVVLDSADGLTCKGRHLLGRTVLATQIASRRGWLVNRQAR